MRPSAAAQVSTSGSGVALSPTSWTRTTSRSGRRRYRPRRMSWSKFSSLTSLSTLLLLDLGAGQQDRAQFALRALELLDLAPGLRRRLLAVAQVIVKRIGGRQVTTDDRINVGQVERVVGLHDGLRCGSRLEGTEDEFQEDTALADAKDTR